ncbi:MAG: SGNH/GDSL hydrolase family protein, partial [Acidimicrobiia bacterium]|nr:SGNH/GDSL hydrolase family protein [Acidimicrobiia bacterium]
MSFLGSLASSLFFSYLCYASTFLTKDGIKFAIGLSTFSLILLVFIIEFLLRVLERFETDSLSSIDAVHLESDGTQLKAAAFYNSYEYISKLDSAKADENLSGKFWSELSAYRRRGMFSRDRQGAIIGNADVSGEFINVVEGLRVTPSQPSDFAGKLHIFGGSTIFAYEVSDGHTPSALLQKKFNESQIGFKVINHGVGGSTIGDCLRRLKLVNISANDVVLVLFGDNDIGINAPRK